ncbi:sugar acetyltransferase [Micromonospora acroterricola]|uniref:Sugar acetyltransferase n=1 Tax=Micromonospora acroterricola TaxID=2202421 RepID=A0A317CYF9_9ACTN|nr:NeuD/PglB/VioB family sugar acetyltransferase [Micromonospora acroterricola]PWR07658.1 sugar acetyltransferase [Micromonospora acroterricola]
MTIGLVVVGCGGHGREVVGISRAVNEAAGRPVWQLLGVVDDRPTEDNLKRLQRLDVPYLGDVAWLRDAPPGTHHVIGIGDPRVRRAVGGRIDGYGVPAASLVHPDATVGPDTAHGPGFVAFAGARVTTNVTIGRHVHLNQNATVGHDSNLADFVSVNPLAAVSGDCHLAEGVLIGTTAAVLQGLRVGRDSTVGAGACVVRDVPDRVTVKGVPAR